MIRAYAQEKVGGLLAAVELAEPPPPSGSEIDVDVLHCSVCHSDVHLLDGEWNAPRPLVPGHEIVGRRTNDGALVGIGWQAGACGTCLPCRTEREHLCTGGKLRTCVGRQGGFATRVRVDARFAYELPSSLDPRVAAPLFCAGLTVFSPLERFGVGTGKKVAVLGLGGLGHLAVRFAKAMGAHVTAFDRGDEKRVFAERLGVDAYGTGAGFDLVLVTTNANLDWDAWMQRLAIEGTLCFVGVPSANLVVAPDRLLDEQKTVTGSVIGSPAAMRRMLAFAATNLIVPVVERMPLEHVNEAIGRVREGKAQMRIVLDI